ncbi:hypothetical protein CM15mP5_1240 [bacterium]|nr:MAG: hypothetical protein CM15mP5_1240 [bacterium]
MLLVLLLEEFSGTNNIFMGGESASLGGDVSGSCNIGLGKSVFQNIGVGKENIALGVNAILMLCNW